MTDDRTGTGGAPHQQPEWLHSHSHEPNPEPPSADATFRVILPDGQEARIGVADLARLPQCQVPGCYIVSTGHGKSGPFTFSGARLVDFVDACLPPHTSLQAVDVISADGFGNRVLADELGEDEGERAILLAIAVDGRPMTRKQGLVRLIVPDETDDALRQVKWIGRVEIHA